MQAALAQFRGNLKRARDIGGLAQKLAAQTTEALDVSDLLRASLVLGVSAFDHFIHEVTRKGMLEIAAGMRPRTDAYDRFSISMASVTNLISNLGHFEFFDDEIRERHGFLSFQEPNKVADAIRLICSKKLWQEVGSIISRNDVDAKIRLKLIVDRRNQIAHEADMDPTVPGMRWPITYQMVEEALDVLDETVAAIFQVATT